MPYVEQASRTMLQPMSTVPARTAGELTYQMYVLAIEYWARTGTYDTGIAPIRAAFIGALDEFNRRHAHPYETRAIQRNGDVLHVSIRGDYP